MVTAKEYQQLPTAGRDQGVNSPLEIPGRTQSCQHLDSGLRETEIVLASRTMREFLLFEAAKFMAIFMVATGN